MRKITIVQVVAATAFALAPAIAGAAPLRAAASLPKQSTADLGAAQRAATPIEGRSDLKGFSVFGFVGLVLVIGLVVVLVSKGGGRSPG